MTTKTTQDLQAQRDAAWGRYMSIVCDDFAALKGLMPEAFALAEEVRRLDALIDATDSHDGV